MIFVRASFNTHSSVEVFALISDLIIRSLVLGELSLVLNLREIECAEGVVECIATCLRSKLAANNGSMRILRSSTCANWSFCAWLTTNRSCVGVITRVASRRVCLTPCEYCVGAYYLRRVLLHRVDTILNRATSFAPQAAARANTVPRH